MTGVAQLECGLGSLRESLGQALKRENFDVFVGFGLGQREVHEKQITVRREQQGQRFPEFAVSLLLVLPELDTRCRVEQNHPGTFRSIDRLKEQSLRDLCASVGCKESPIRGESKVVVNTPGSRGDSFN